LEKLLIFYIKELNMKKVDAKDLLLLDLLSEGSRKGRGRIAKELKIHKNSVQYRINRLKRMGILKSFSFIPGFETLGKDTYYVFLRLRVKEEEKKEVYDYLESHPLALWVLRLSGKWNVMIELVCDNIRNFNEELAKITDFLGKRLADYKTVLLYIPFKVESSINFKKNYKEEHFKLPEESIKLNLLDQKVLGILSDNSALSYNEIAEKSGASADTVFYRVKRMSESGVIRKFVPIINIEKLGFQNYAVLVKLSDVTSERFTILRDYLVNNRNISFSFRTAGELGVLC
jgi:DNA-binding Lrp family transcriptional regulator